MNVINSGRLGLAGRRLLIICAEYPPTKVAEADHAYHLASQFARRGTDVTVLTSTTHEQRPTTPGVTVASVMPSWSFLDLPRFARFLRSCRPDAILLVYLAGIYSDKHPMITLAASIAGRVVPRATFVTQFENSMGANPRSLTTRILWKLIRPLVPGATVDYSYGTLLRDSRKIIVLSERHREPLRDACSSIDGRSELIPPAPIMSVSPPGDSSARSRDREALGFKDDEVVFAYYGYLYPSKGIETMLEAFALFGKQRKDARLLVIGGFVEHPHSPSFASRSRSYQASVMELATTLGIDGKITWAGHCPSTELTGSRYLRASDVCILPFDNGVYLNNSSFAAAATHGLPIVTTAGERVETPIVDGENVLLSPPRNPAALASVMTRAAEDAALRSRLSRGAEALAREWFDWDRVVERIGATFTDEASTPAATLSPARS
jgi:polysaccharide biosynthesis protein PslF